MRISIDGGGGWGRRISRTGWRTNSRAPVGGGERAAERVETDTALAQRLVREVLAAVRWREVDLALQPKGHPVKVEVARELRRQTPMSRRWIAERLRMGSVSYVSNLLASVDSKL